jgi:hypothetical protein
VLGGKGNLRSRYKAFRKKILSFTPLIRRSRHERALARLQRQLDYERKTNEGMGSLFFAPPLLAASARHVVLAPFKGGGVEELCLFVSHAAGPRLKPHVIDHIGALIDAGVAVVLVVNSDVEPSTLQLPTEFASRLHGCLARENVGFDFAAWAHGYCLLEAGAVRRRLYLVNDSIIGPLDRTTYEALLQRIRNSHADALGLTSNPDPHPHLQSYYLVFNERLLHSPVCESFMRNVVNMPLKQNVIDCYEIWLSPFLERKGFRTAAIFPSLSRLPPPKRNDTLCAWRELIDLGFPFVKSMVLRDPVEGEAARRLLPARYL